MTMTHFTVEVTNFDDERAILSTAARMKTLSPFSSDTLLFCFLRRQERRHIITDDTDTNSVLVSGATHPTVVLVMTPWLRHDSWRWQTANFFIKGKLVMTSPLTMDLTGENTIYGGKGDDTIVATAS